MSQICFVSLAAESTCRTKQQFVIRNKHICFIASLLQGPSQAYVIDLVRRG